MPIRSARRRSTWRPALPSRWWWARACPGVERYLHFTLNGCNEKGYDYGITRGDPAFPLPTALSYAAAAQALEDAQPVERVQAAEKLWRASFACPQRNELIIAWWSEGEAQLLHLPTAAPWGTWKSSFFQSLSAGGAVVRGVIQPDEPFHVSHFVSNKLLLVRIMAVGRDRASLFLGKPSAKVMRVLMVLLAW